MEFEEKAKKVKLLLCDVDGVLTDGSVILDEKGRELKSFNVKDGHGIKLLQRMGIEVGFISGRFSEATLRRAEELSISKVYVGVKNKVSILDKILNDLGISLDEVAYIGDDLVDIPIMKRVGFPIAVSDSVDEVKEIAAYITKSRGGKGAVREVAEIILKSKGLWEKVLERYFY